MAIDGVTSCMKIREVNKNKRSRWRTSRAASVMERTDWNNPDHADGPGSDWDSDTTDQKPLWCCADFWQR